MDRPTVTTTHRCDRAPVCRFTDCAAQAGAIEYWLIDGGCVAFQPALEPEWDRNRAMGAFIAGHVWEGNPSLGEALAALIDDVLAHEERSERLSQAEMLLRRAFARGLWGDENNEIRNDIGRFLAGKSVEPVCTDCASLNAGVALADACDELNVAQIGEEWAIVCETISGDKESAASVRTDAAAIEAAVAKVRKLAQQKGGDAG